MPDLIQLLKKYNCLAIIQPLGSKNDKKIIDFAKQNKIPLYFTKNRVFKHWKIIQQKFQLILKNWSNYIQTLKVEEKILAIIIKEF